MLVGMMLLHAALLAAGTARSENGPSGPATDPGVAILPWSTSVSAADVGRKSLEQFTGVPVDAAERAKRLVAIVEENIDAVRTSDTLAHAGRYLLAVLAAVVFSWTIIKNMVLKPGLPQLVADLVFPGVVLALGLSAINGNFAAAVARLLDATALALVGSPRNQGGIALHFLASTSEMLVSVWSTTPPVDYLTLGIHFLRSLVLQAIATLLVAIAGAIGLAMLFVAKLQVAIACALAPVMIPWLLWRPTEFLFTGWLTFLVRGGFVAIAVYAIERVMTHAMEGVATFAAGVQPGFDSSLTYGLIGVLALVFAFMMLKAAEIGAGLVGGAVVGLGGFGTVLGGLAAPVRAAVRVTTLRGAPAAGMAGGASTRSGPPLGVRG